MRSVILYAYPPEPDGLSLQGDLLYHGMKENGEEAIPCHISSEFQKEWSYKYFKPDVAIGVGYWGHTPDLILHPQQFGVTPIPWFVADGWIANYHDAISSLPLVLATSTWVKKTYERDGVNTKNFEVVPIGFDLDLFKPISRSDPRVKMVRKMLKIADDELMILTIGGDVTSKGAQEVLKALKHIDKEFKKWKYVCKVWGGDSADDHYDAEMALIEELGEESKDKVIYLEGSLSPDFMPVLLSAADIYAAPSRLEGFGMIQVEAQACGIPVISIDKMGPQETILHGETGFLAKVAETVELTSEIVHPGMGFEEEGRIHFEKPKIFAYRADINELADFLLKLLTNKELREKMGSRGREHALASFEYHKISKKIADLAKERLNLL
ncbi:MAG: glycosyl transferase family 1 [Candidatus Harrisonbacteria bacterium CG10_big_fil_rev_8_21_14_0_10_40_38]|uniref:Glycosyl transferase family 1 n=1 Tax=Candidatus Harrisonbacteria bacterium CG10_big_fil_rev_8_21_14_0_10_40_38 TaxID=1974583 RepID=A0A2H0UT65_9BACT|nr:MAG: glycosyl transferase family 1 [Candidatus Harrisonbacteria bacterium CG10_big_fil_rev_8_21_14_0_10_40_38]